MAINVFDRKVVIFESSELAKFEQQHQGRLEKMAQRIRAAKLLSEGKTYNQVIEETDISSATLSRVSKALRYGKGYKKFI